jgi:hypothetical protein
MVIRPWRDVIQSHVKGGSHAFFLLSDNIFKRVNRSLSPATPWRVKLGNASRSPRRRVRIRLNRTRVIRFYSIGHVERTYSLRTHYLFSFSFPPLNNLSTSCCRSGSWKQMTSEKKRAKPRQKKSLFHHTTPLSPSRSRRRLFLLC